jgi:hypothetical protein
MRWTTSNQDEERRDNIGVLRQAGDRERQPHPSEV